MVATRTRAPSEAVPHPPRGFSCASIVRVAPAAAAAPPTSLRKSRRLFSPSAIGTSPRRPGKLSRPAPSTDGRRSEMVIAARGTRDPRMERHGRPAALSFIFITVLLDMLALGIVIPVLPNLVRSFLQGDTAKAAETIGLFTTAWGVMQFLFSPLIGLVSDRYGRRRVILLSNLGLGLDHMIMALAPTVGWLFVGRILSGITSASIATAFAYVSDVTPADKRARSFGLLGAAFGVGFVLGPAIGGVLGAENPRLPFWFAACLSLLNALYGLFVLPESLPPERRQERIRWWNANPVGALGLLRRNA